ncbi:hypothetical protein DYBT9623_04435 [Dyadobacter sp. CECT 9623]|uniref:DUF4231 domain-containing protein n=1 Tax=Dyadobacter linearis TaxID=2823330 RepID=A0ABN7RDH7_9BACT|nr:hypothetical protein [Dyadobacter sp. CECT 9623]CAG5072897.1 hypothetical protein DYBT9623_04435 [Dyadobacter sp. CECT 9623]
MDNTVSTQVENDLKAEIAAEINKRKKWINIDFKLAHWFVWISLIASFTSAILTVADPFKEEYRWITAVIAGLPGLVVSIDKIFDFKSRAVWGIFYEIDLHEVQDAFNWKKVDAYSSAQALRQVVRKNEGIYRNIGFFGSNEVVDLSNNSETNVAQKPENAQPDNAAKQPAAVLVPADASVESAAPSTTVVKEDASTEEQAEKKVDNS